MVSVPKRHDMSFLVFSLETSSRVGLCFPMAGQHLAGSGVTLKLDGVAHFGGSKFNIHVTGPSMSANRII